MIWVIKFKGYKFSGTGYGRWCLCGNKPPDYALLLPRDECNVPCAGLKKMRYEIT